MRAFEQLCRLQVTGAETASFFRCDVARIKRYLQLPAYREAWELELIDTLPAEELTVSENRRIKTALSMARLATIKTLAGFDFSFQPWLA